MASLSESVGGPSVKPWKRVRRRLPLGNRSPEQRERPEYEQLATHPLVIAVSAALVLVGLGRFGVGARSVAGLVLLPALVVLSVIDVRHRLLPNRIVLPATGLVLVSQLAFAADHGVESVLACVAAGAALFVLHVVYPQGLGMGDVKLALLLGAALGTGAMVALFVGSLAGAAAGVVVIARHGAAGRKVALPFGPFLAFGAAVAFFLAG
jgi:leader peptidase (prepilin peptidase) / N-methyltransferase